MPSERLRSSTRLRPFADSDLSPSGRSDASGRALDAFPRSRRGARHGRRPGEWRIHFHVPLFTSEYDGLGSTQDDVRTVHRGRRRDALSRSISRSRPTPGTCCPRALKIDLVESIAREYDWVLETACLNAEPMHKTVVLNVVGLTPVAGAGMPRLARWASAAADGARSSRRFPAVTCTAQADYLTGSYPERHGIVGNGWYSRDDCEVRFWKQSNPLVQAPKLWDAARAERPVVHRGEPVLVVQHVLDGGLRGHAAADVSGRRPQDPGRLHESAGSLRDELQPALGTFPLFEFWGPRASIRSSEWIADAAKIVEQKFNPTLTLIYLPHLDYNLQRLGVRRPRIGARPRGDRAGRR